jgi:AcrR family transcriptional regulator
MGKSLSKSERTKQFIVERTAPVFNEKGYAGTSLSDLESATGLTKGSIYGNFENKDEVALAAFDYNFAYVTDFLKTRIVAKEDAIERLLVYPKVYRDFLANPILKAGCPILNTSTEADDTHPKLRQRAADALDFWKASLENQINRGIHRGEIKPDTQAAEFAVVIMSLIEGALMQAKVTGRSNELRVAMRYLEHLIRALKT